MLTRTLYVRAPRQLDNPYTHLLRLRRALYGFSDSGDYWDETLARELGNHTNRGVSMGDPALYFGNASGASNIDSIIVTKVLDVLNAGSPAFQKRTLHLERCFEASPRDDPPLSFSGATLSPLPASFYKLQPTHVRRAAENLADGRPIR